MRILYVASAVSAGGTSGGATHVREVACGLSALGHELLVITRRAPHAARHNLDCGVPLLTSPFPQQTALLGLPQVVRAFSRFKPDAVMERFYNFAGAGILLAHLRRVPSLLEVNAPMYDPPGSLKSRVDALLFGSMRRWAARQGKWSSCIVTPLASTVPPEVSRRKIVELPWGANVERFDPKVRVTARDRLEALRSELGLEPGVPVAVFLGSFRSWHGAADFAKAAHQLLTGGSKLAFLAVGGGPELEAVREKVANWGLPPGRFVFAGPQPHERVPDYLGIADIGVAPFDLAAHPPLAAFGFYWSPLKVFEYMSMGLPVVTLDVPPLNGIVRHEQEGLLYPPGDLSALASALERLAGDRDQRLRLGASARERVRLRYSWQAHCLALEGLLRRITHAR